MARPAKYKTPEDMQRVIDQYFADCEERERPLTITGLAAALGMTRKGLLYYEREGVKDEFVPTISKAKLRVEQFNEENLYRTGQVTGVIFNLKNNFGWQDQQDINNRYVDKSGEDLVSAKDLEIFNNLKERIKSDGAESKK